MSGLRLDSREAMLKGGTRGVVVKPGDPEGSLLFKAVQHEVAPHMPPTGKLSDAKIAVLRDWIASGAEWEETSNATVPSCTTRRCFWVRPGRSKAAIAKSVSPAARLSKA